MSILRGTVHYLRWLLPAMALALLGPATSAQRGGVTTSYGYAVFGDLKYGPGYRHFEYVDPAAPKGGSYRYGILGTFDSLNPISLMGIFPPAILFFNDSLMKQSRDEPASYYCLVCKSLSWPEDLSWVEFEIEPAARFSDGRPVTADDVIYSIELGKGLTQAVFTRAAQAVERIEKTGPRSVRVHFTMTDNPTLLTTIGYMPIVAKHYWEKRDPTKPSLDRPVLLSPYLIEEVRPGHAIVFRRDPDYWGADHPVNRGRYNFDVVRNDYYRDLQLQNEAFRAGLADLRLDTSAAELRTEAGLAAVESGDIVRAHLPYDNGAIYNALSLNSRRPFLADRRVREALVLAYDFEWVKRVVLGGDYGRLDSNFPNSDFTAEGMPQGGELALLEEHRDVLPPAIFTEALSQPQGGSRARMRANLLRARDLLRQAGYRVKDGKLIDKTSGEPVVLDLIAYSPLVYNQVALFVANAARLGIEVRFRAVDAAQMRHLLSNYDYDVLYYRTVFAPLPTPSAGLAIMWTEQPVGSNLLNYSGIDHPAIDDAIRRMIAATDRRTVVDMLRAVDRIARFEHYSIPLQHSYPAPVGTLSISHWDKFGRPKVEQTWNFPYWSADTWWYDPARAARLSHGVYQ